MLIDMLRQHRIFADDVNPICIDGTRAATIFLQGKPEFSDLPPCVPIAPLTWVDVNLSGQKDLLLDRPELKTVLSGVADRWGLLLVNQRIQNAPRTIVLNDTKTEHKLGWCVDAQVWVGLLDKFLYYNVAQANLMFDTDGLLINLPIGLDRRFVANMDRISRSPSGVLARELSYQWIAASLFGLSLFHTAMVGRVYLRPGRQQVRAAQREGKPPLLPWWQLSTDDWWAKLRSKGALLQGLGPTLRECRSWWRVAEAEPCLHPDSGLWVPNGG